MNKRDRQQLKASIAKDLVQGQGEHSPTKELLRQYAPLEGVMTTPRSRPRPARLWKTPWHLMPPWHDMSIHHGTMPRWHQMLR